MYNNTVIAILEKAGLITHEAGEELAKQLVDKIHPARYPDALNLVEAASEKIKDFAAEPWLADIARLERRVVELEKERKPVAKQKVG